MKRKISGLIGVIMLTATTNLHAAGLIPNPSRIDSLEELINALAALIRPIFLVTFTIMILYGAFVYLTARDDANKVQSARSIIIAAIIGFVIAVFAPVIVDLVAKFLGVPGLSVGNP